MTERKRILKKLCIICMFPISSSILYVSSATVFEITNSFNSGFLFKKNILLYFVLSCVWVNRVLYFMLQSVVFFYIIYIFFLFKVWTIVVLQNSLMRHNCQNKKNTQKRANGKLLIKKIEIISKSYLYLYF